MQIYFCFKFQKSHRGLSAARTENKMRDNGICNFSLRINSLQTLIERTNCAHFIILSLLTPTKATGSRYLDDRIIAVSRI